MEGFSSAPVKEGEQLDVKIIAVGDKGDGIAKKDGFVLVIPGTKVDDEVTIKVTKVLRKVAFAEVVSSNTPSESSADPESSDDMSEEEEEPALAEDSETFGDNL